jgi:hypothetical protein
MRRRSQNTLKGGDKSSVILSEAKDLMTLRKESRVDGDEMLR